MELQTVINILIMVAGGFGGWILNALWNIVRDLQNADTKLAEKVASIEVLVAGKYVTRDALDKCLDVLFAKLDRIENKIDQKADRET